MMAVGFVQPLVPAAWGWQLKTAAPTRTSLLCPGPTSSPEGRWARGQSSAGASVAAVAAVLTAAWSRPSATYSAKKRAKGYRLQQQATEEAQAAVVEVGTTLPPVWVVNLDRSPDRWVTCQEECAREGVKVERFTATDGKAMTPEELAKETTLTARWFCTKGMIGCFMSHRRIWERVAKEGLEAVVVLEDDVRLEPGFNQRLGALLAQLPADWEVCLLGAVGCVNPDVEPWYMKYYSFCTGGGRASPGKTRRIAPGVFVPHRPAGTHAYMVSQRGAARLLKHLPKAQYHVDLSAWALPDLKLLAAADFLATQDFEGVSTVSKAGESVTSRFLRWAWTISGLAYMGKRAGVPHLSWAWKAAIFAAPFNGRRIAVEMGPMSSVFVVLLLTAAGLRSPALLAVAIMYQGLICSCIRYLCGTGALRFLLGHVLVSAALVTV